MVTHGQRRSRRTGLASALLVFTQAACDTLHGVRREAEVYAVPDLPRLKAHLESYPELREVKWFQRQEGALLTLTGIHAGDECSCVIYRGGEDIHGALMFTRDHAGRILYSQSLLQLNRPPPQAWIDASWPVMKRIEQDLARDFGLPELRVVVEVDVVGDVEDPERPLPGRGP